MKCGNLFFQRYSLLPMVGLFVKCGTGYEDVNTRENQKSSDDFSLASGKCLPGQSVADAPGVLLWP